jgi:hypothetical protein
MAGFLAYILPIDGGNRPDQGLPGAPPGIWGGAPGQPGVGHPIAPGGQPPGIWGGSPPGIWGGAPGQDHPHHPMAPGGPPPGIWGGAPGQPGTGHPIAPGGGPSQGGPFPTPPIFIGPPVPAPEPPPPLEWHSAYSTEHGWMTVGIPTGETPTPSA